MRYLLMLFLLCFSISSAWAYYAPTARPFRYTNNNTANQDDDALSPLETQLLKQVDPEKRKAFHNNDTDNGKLLTMIIHRHGAYIAYIGEKEIHLGDMVGHMRVTKITQHSVTLDDGQNSVTLHLAGITHYSKQHKPLNQSNTTKNTLH